MRFLCSLITCSLLVVLAVAARGAPAPAPKQGKGPLGMKFVALPKAKFFMGGGGGKAGKETEIRESFEIAIHTVTQGQWREVMGNNPSTFSRNGEEKEKVKDITDEELKLFPVETVSWNDTRDFIKKLNEMERDKGYLYRLPTRVEWDYACRGGATSEEECSYHFYFKEPTNDLSSRQANFDGNLPVGLADKGPNLGRPSKVGSYAPNKLGIYDMHGNVHQWCEDLFGPLDSRRVHIGGCWAGSGANCQAWGRDRGLPTLRNCYIGFRLARVRAGS
jgi:eukaryotic-like serine/threonine-protein kinase